MDLTVRAKVQLAGALQGSQRVRRTLVNLNVPCSPHGICARQQEVWRPLPSRNESGDQERGDNYGRTRTPYGRIRSSTHEPCLSWFAM